MGGSEIRMSLLEIKLNNEQAFEDITECQMLKVLIARHKENNLITNWIEIEIIDNGRK